MSDALIERISSTIYSRSFGQSWKVGECDALAADVLNTIEAKYTLIPKEDSE